MIQKKTPLTFRAGKRVATLHGSEFDVQTIIRLALQKLQISIDFAEGRVKDAQGLLDLGAKASFVERQRLQSKVTMAQGELQRLTAQREEYRNLILGESEVPAE